MHNSVLFFGGGGGRRPRKNFARTYILQCSPHLFFHFHPSIFFSILQLPSLSPILHPSSPILSSSLPQSSPPPPPPTLFFSPSLLHVHYATLCIFHDFVNPIMSAKAESIAELVAHCKIHPARNPSHKGNWKTNFLHQLSSAAFGKRDDGWNLGESSQGELEGVYGLQVQTAQLQSGLWAFGFVTQGFAFGGHANLVLKCCAS